MSEVAIVLLAAGGSERMGTPKQLLDFGGKPLIRHAAETALASGCQRVIVVGGAHLPPVRAALDGLPVELAVNPQWTAGMGTSIQTGVRAALAHGADAVILALADQPLITAAIYNRLMDSQRTSRQPIVSASYAGTVGVPVLFTSEYFPSLLELQPSQGCKGVILRHAANALLLEVPEAEADVDTPGDYARLQPAVR